MATTPNPTSVQQDSFIKLFSIQENLQNSIDEVKEELQELRAESLRISTRFQNSTLTNPTFQIAPLVIYKKGQGLIRPDLALFPQHANEFYSLRSSSTDRLREMLSYLVQFYSITTTDQEQPSIRDSHNGDKTIEQVNDESCLQVEILGGVLGLVEDNFTTLKGRGKETTIPLPKKEGSLVNDFITPFAFLALVYIFLFFRR